MRSADVDLILLLETVGFPLCWFSKSLLLCSLTTAWYLAKFSLTVPASLFYTIFFRIRMKLALNLELSSPWLASFQLRSSVLRRTFGTATLSLSNEAQ